MAISAPRLGALRERRFPRALLAICCAFVAGLYGSAVPGSLGIGLVAATLPTLVVLRRSRHHALPLIAACALAAAGGYWRGESAAYCRTPSQVAYYVGHSVVAVGVVDAEPVPAGTGVNLPVQVDALQVDGHTVAAAGRILVHAAGSVDTQYGDKLQLSGRLALPYRQSGFDYAAYLSRQGIHAVLNYPSLLILAHGDGNAVQAQAMAVRSRLRTVIVRMLPHAEAALLTGMLLGASTHSLGDLTDAYVTVGMIHIVAISGLKVSLVAGLLTALCRPLRRRRRRLPALVGVAVYVLLTGGTPSGMRSALMWGLAVVAAHTGRRSDVWVSLSLVAAAMLCRTPQLLWDAGFQLSVTGTGGIVAFTPWFERYLQRLPAVLRESAAVTLAAQTATLPLTAIGFGQVSLVGPVANGLLLPFLGPIMAAGFVSATLALLFPAALPVAGALLYPWLHGFNIAVRVLAQIPHAAVSWPQVPPAVVWLYYLLVIAIAVRTARGAGSGSRRGGPLALLAGAPLLVSLLTIVAVALVSVLAAARSGQVDLYASGAGHGQVVILRSSDGRTVLLDGGDSPSDVSALLGAHLPFWQRSLDTLLISEPDRAHLAGLTGVTGLYNVGRVLDPGSEFPSAAYAAFRAELRGAGVPDQKAVAGRMVQLGGDAEVKVLLPAPEELSSGSGDAAYLLRAGTLKVLVVNREALSDGNLDAATIGCVDALVLPLRADSAAAEALARALHPSLLIVAPPSGSGATAEVKLPPLPGITIWRTQQGRELRLTTLRSHCTRS